MPTLDAGRSRDRVPVRSIEPAAVYSIAEVEALLDVSRKTVLRLIEEKQLPASRVGRQYRIAGAFLLDFLTKVATVPRRAEDALARYLPAPALLLSSRRAAAVGISEEDAVKDALRVLARVRHRRR